MLGVATAVLIGGIRRFGQDVHIDTGPMLLVGVLGLVVNLIVLAMLHGGAAESLNVKGAYLEVMADTIGSGGVVAATPMTRGTGRGVAAALGGPAARETPGGDPTRAAR